MITSLQENNALVLHNIDDAVLETQPPGPDIRSKILESLGLAESGEWISLDIQNKVKNTHCISFIVFDPKLEVPEKLRPESKLTPLFGHQPPHRAAF